MLEIHSADSTVARSRAIIAALRSNDRVSAFKIQAVEFSDGEMGYSAPRLLAHLVLLPPDEPCELTVLDDETGCGGFFMKELTATGLHCIPRDRASTLGRLINLPDDITATELLRSMSRLLLAQNVH